MALYKRVNGVRVKLTPEEEAKLLERWKIDDKKRIIKNSIERRKRHYPPVGEQLDLIYQTIKYLRDSGIDVGSAGQKLINKIEKVKKDYPIIGFDKS